MCHLMSVFPGCVVAGWLRQCLRGVCTPVSPGGVCVCVRALALDVTRRHFPGSRVWQGTARGRY